MRLQQPVSRLFLVHVGAFRHEKGELGLRNVVSGHGCGAGAVGPVLWHR